MAGEFRSDVSNFFHGKITCYRANTAATEAYLKSTSPWKVSVEIFLVDSREWDNFFWRNVHLCISLREMPKMPRHAAIKQLEKYASRNAP